MANNRRTNIPQETKDIVIKYFKTHYNNSARDISENTAIPFQRVKYILESYLKAEAKRINNRTLIP